MIILIIALILKRFTRHNVTISPSSPSLHCICVTKLFKIFIHHCIPLSVKKLVDIVATGSMLMLLMNLPTSSPICQLQCFKKQKSQIEKLWIGYDSIFPFPTTSPEQEWSGYQQGVCCSSVWSNFQFDQIWSRAQALHRSLMISEWPA